MPRPARRAWGLFLTAGVLLLVGTNVQAGWLFALASLLLGVVVAGCVLPRGMIRGVEVERRAPAEVFAGEDVSVDLVVTNSSDRPKLSLLVQDDLIAPTTAFIKSLSPAETAIVSGRRLAVRRGVVDAGDVRIWSDAPFGVAFAQKTIPAPGRTVIFPRVVPITWLPDLASAAKPLEEALVRARKGAGHDFLGIREYRAGDALRHVHWPSTARHGSLMVREFEQELPRRLGIFVDTWADTGRTDGETALDVCCSVAASIALYATGTGHPLALAAARPGETSPEILSQAARTEALTWLAELEAPAGPPLPAAVEAALPGLGRLDTLVIACPTWRPNGGGALSRIAGSLTEAGLQVIVALVEAGTFDPGEDPAPALDTASVEDLIRDLATSGASVYRIRAKEDLAGCLEHPLAG